MANTHHPENKQPQGEGNNLGQINERACYVLVEKAGTDDEKIIDEFPTFRAMYNRYLYLYDTEEREALGVDFFKKLPDGTLTTEF